MRTNDKNELDIPAELQDSVSLADEPLDDEMSDEEVERYEFNGLIQHEIRDNSLKLDNWLKDASRLPQLTTPSIPISEVPKYTPIMVKGSSAKAKFRKLKWDDGCIHEIRLPRGIDAEIENRCRMKDGSTLSPEVRQLCAVVYGLILNPNIHTPVWLDESGRRKPAPKRISSRFLQSVCQNVCKYTEIISMLEQAMFISVNHSYSVDWHLSKEYKALTGNGHSLTSRAREIVNLDRLAPKGYRVRPKGKPEIGELASYLLWSYSAYSLPSPMEVETEANRMVANDVTIKGEKLIYIKTTPVSKHSSQDGRNLYFEVMHYARLLQYGLTFPHTTNCPRVNDSFTIMPSWIRKMIKIDNESIVELDYKALHPNLMFWAFKNSIPSVENDFFKDYLACDTHTKMVSQLRNMEVIAGDVDVVEVRRKVKREHLSFFNTTEDRLKNYLVYKVYNTNMPCFMELVRKSKRSDGEHARTSSLLFHLEVDLMTEVCRRLRLAEIKAIYVFDALYVKQSAAKQATTIMNQVAADFGITTYVS